MYFVDACSASRDDRSCFPSGRILGVYSSSMLVVHILQSRSSIQCFTPTRLRACLSSPSRSNTILVFMFWLLLLLLARITLLSLCSLFSTALRFKEKHLLLDCFVLPSAPALTWHSHVQNFQVYSPTGSYLSMLSGRWVRGRRKVMKKPVRAIDMRRTATVLDFAVKQFSRASHVNWDVRPYLSSPFCVMWIDDATPENGDLVVVVVGLGGRQAVGGVCGHVRFGNGCGSIGRSSTSCFLSTTCLASISIGLIQLLENPGWPSRPEKI